MRVLGLEGGLSGPSSARGAMLRGVLGSRASEGQRELFAQGAEPDGRGYRLGIRPFEVDRMAALASGRCAGGQAEMREDLGDHGRMFDACPEPIEGAAMIFKGAAAQAAFGFLRRQRSGACAKQHSQMRITVQPPRRRVRVARRSLI